MRVDSEQIVYKLLSKVFASGAYGSVELNKALLGIAVSDRPYITRLFYGVLDKSIQFDYIISKVASKKPKLAVMILLKMGLFLARYSDTPDYASVSKIVELCKKVGKGGVAGFVNAVLKKSITIALPKINDEFSLSVNSSFPLWLVQELISDYGYEFTKDYLVFDVPTNTHIRCNTTNISKEDFEAKYSKIGLNKSKYGYHVTHNAINLLENSDYIVQSLSSCMAVNCYIDKIKPKKILDLCSAPGGKAVYCKQLIESINVTACDIHPHRVELIKKYAENVGVKINVLQNDATVLCNEWCGKFDLVICDVPCSGIGVVKKKPEILLNRTKNDVVELSKLQYEILSTANKYVASGGRLCYSTCTTLKAENERVVEKFLVNNKDFVKDGENLSLFPHIDNCDGFFVASFTKV